MGRSEYASTISVIAQHAARMRRIGRPSGSVIEKPER
jgi:hypothetical protein